MTPAAGQVAVIGAGRMGAQIGAEYALGGHAVVLVARTADSTSDACRRAAQAIDALAAAGLCDARVAGEAKQRVRPGTGMEQACRAATIVVESVGETFEGKVEVLRAAGRAAPEAIIATNTSSLPIGALGEAAGIGRRFIGTHYWNPPILMPLVELVPSAWTDPVVRDRMHAVLTAIGKEPVVVSDVPGFVWNRLQFALLREAASLVARGVVDAPTLDRIVRDGLGRRWSLIGPFETMALGGRDTFRAIANQLFPDLAATADDADLARVPLADHNALTERAAARDAALIAWRSARRR